MNALVLVAVDIGTEVLTQQAFEQMAAFRRLRPSRQRSVAGRKTRCGSGVRRGYHPHLHRRSGCAPSGRRRGHRSKSRPGAVVAMALLLLAPTLSHLGRPRSMGGRCRDLAPEAEPNDSPRGGSCVGAVCQSGTLTANDQETHPVGGLAPRRRLSRWTFRVGQACPGRCHEHPCATCHLRPGCGVSYGRPGDLRVNSSAERASHSHGRGAGARAIRAGRKRDERRPGAAVVGLRGAHRADRRQPRTATWNPMTRWTRRVPWVVRSRPSLTSREARMCSGGDRRRGRGADLRPRCPGARRVALHADARRRRRPAARDRELGPNQRVPPPWRQGPTRSRSPRHRASRARTC